MRSRRATFRPSLLSTAIALAATGLSHQALAVDLCFERSSITISAATSDDTCVIDTSGASLTVPVGQVLSNGVILDNSPVTIINAGTISASGAEEVTDWSPYVETSVAAITSGDFEGSLQNNGTLRASLVGTVHATGSASSGYTTSGYWYSSSADGRFWGAARGVDVHGLGAAQIVNAGSIDVSVTGTVSADDGSGYGYLYADGIFVSGNQVEDVTNTGAILASATLDADYGFAMARGIAIEGEVSSAIVNRGRISASAVVNTDRYADATAYGVYIEGGIGSGGSFSNESVIDAVVTGGGDRRARRIGPGGGGRAVGVMIDGNSGSSGPFLMAFTSGPYAALSGGASFSNSGRITARLGADSTGGSLTGVWLEDMVGGASFSNAASGIIEARGGDAAYVASATGLQVGRIEDDATASNAGLISGSVEDALSVAYAQGLWVEQVGSSGSFDNSGRIEASANGSFYVNAIGASLQYVNGGDLVNTGSISAMAQSRVNSADATGVYVDSLDSMGEILNEGTISARAGVQDSGSARANGMRFFVLDGSVINRGTISAGLVTPDLSPLEEGDGFPDMMSMGPGYGQLYSLFASYGSGVVSNESEGLLDGAVYLSDLISLENAGRIISPATTGSRIGGNYTQTGDGVFELEIRDIYSYGSLQVGGTADFTGSSSIVVSVDPLAQIADGDAFEDVVYANFLVNPDGFAVSDTSLFWDFESSEDVSSLDLVARYLGAAEVLGESGATLTPEQLGLAEDLLLGNLGPDFAPLVDALNRAPDAAAAAEVLESAGPALAGAQGFSARGASQGATNAISARLAELRGAASGDAFQQNAVWIKPYLGMAEQDSVNGVDGYDVNTAGFVLGIDGDISDNWRVGVGVASALTDVEGDKADLDVETVQLALYASYAISDSAALDLDLSHVSNRFDSSRRVGFAGTTALANYDGTQFAVGAAVSNRVALGEKGAFVPALQVRYNRFSLDGYSETGAGVFNLSVDNQTEDSLQWLARGGFEFGVGSGTLLASAGVGYDTLDAAIATASFAGGGPTYVSNGIKPDSTIVTGGLGYRYVTAKNLEINAAYDAESRGGDYLAQTVSVKFRLPF